VPNKPPNENDGAVAGVPNGPPNGGAAAGVQNKPVEGLIPKLDALVARPVFPAK
jgi:hypothetical protein